MALPRLRQLLLSLAVLAAGAAAHNITDILAPFPEYAQYNSFLTQTKLADEVNNRQTITVLVLANPAASSLAGRPLPDVKTALSLLVLLDYFDTQKLHELPDGSANSTTLYQTTGVARGNEGFVHILDQRGGVVAFASAAAASGAKPDATLVKAIKLTPFNISVLEVSGLILPPGLLVGPPPGAPSNLSATLEKAGCGIFAALLVKTGVIKTYESAVGKGLTVFAPLDAAFNTTGVPDIGKLSSADAVALLLYHALPEYAPAATLKSSGGRPFATLATNGASKYEVSATAAGDQITIHAGTSAARVTTIAVDAPPEAVLVVDSLLLPQELFGKAPTPAPTPSPRNASSPSPAPAHAPTHLPPGPAPSPRGGETVSPPAPPSPPSANSPEPAEGPAPDGGGTPPSDAGNGKWGMPLEALVAVSAVMGSWAVAMSRF